MVFFVALCVLVLLCGSRFSDVSRLKILLLQLFSPFLQRHHLGRYIFADGFISHIAIGVKATRKGVGKDLGFCQRVQVYKYANLAQMILRAGRAHATRRA